MAHVTWHLELDKLLLEDLPRRLNFGGQDSKRGHVEDDFVGRNNGIGIPQDGHVQA